MKTAKNDITGDSIQTKATSQAYADNYERIFGKKERPRYQPIDVDRLSDQPNRDLPDDHNPIR